MIFFIPREISQKQKSAYYSQTLLRVALEENSVWLKWLLSYFAERAAKMKLMK